MPTAELDRTALNRVVAVINGKGGVGKTTLTANIGGVLAASGWSVLLVDMDPQGNLRIEAGYKHDPRDDSGKKLSASIVFGMDITPMEGIKPNLDIVPGGSHLNIAEKFLQGSDEGGGDNRLAFAAALSVIAGNYDIVLIDCPPGNRGLQTAAAAAANYLFIPTRSDEASLDGLKITADLVSEVSGINPDVSLLGVVITNSGVQSVNVRREFGKDIATSLGIEADSDIIFSSYTRFADSTAYASRKQGVLAFELEDKVKRGPKWYESLRTGAKHNATGPASATTVADDIQAVTNEFVERLTKLSTEAGE